MAEERKFRLLFRVSPTLLEFNPLVVEELPPDLPGGGEELPTIQALLPRGPDEPGTIQGIVARGAPTLDLSVRRMRPPNELRQFVIDAQRESVVIVDRSDVAETIRAISSQMADITDGVLIVERDDP